MLLSLHIENVAIIRRVDVDFSRGFTAFTGETGAGKSILIDSIGFLLGGRVSRDLLSHGAKEARVSGLFGAFSESEIAALAEWGLSPDEDGTILFERTLSDDGRSQSRINGRMVNLSLLRQAASAFVQIHGQAETAMLADKNYAIETLDRYANHTKELIAYRQAYHTLNTAKKTLDAHLAAEGERLRLEETLKNQIAEIKKIAPKRGEEDALYEQKNRLKNAERISKLSGYVFRALKGGERGNALYILEHIRQPLIQLADIIPELSGEAEKLERLISDLDGMAENVRAYLEEGEDDPTEALNRLEERLDLLFHLSLKYGGSVDACLSFLADAEKKLSSLENYDDTTAALRASYEAARKDAENEALILEAGRVAAAKKMTEKMTATLKTLDMPRIHMEIAVTNRKNEAGELSFDENGCNDVRFLFSANSGEALGELSRVASGGEVSRVMLALQDALAEHSGVGTAIYDEIDTGVSGKTARKIGVKMLTTATRGQVFCVTHSAQIASLADTHYLIRKEEADGRTHTVVNPLEMEARVEEIARILGGIQVTEAQRSAAREMLERNDVSYV